MQTFSLQPLQTVLVNNHLSDLQTFIHPKAQLAYSAPQSKHDKCLELAGFSFIYQ